MLRDLLFWLPGHGRGEMEDSIERIRVGLRPLIEKLMDPISVDAFTMLESLLKTATQGLTSGEVIDMHDQYDLYE